MAIQAGALAGLMNLGSVAPDYAGMGLNYLGTGVLTGNWGGTSKERKNQIHDIRTLRRREYQDMVHSLTKAGLNPILAVGATPGHATAQNIASTGQLAPFQAGSSAGVGSAMAAHRQAGIGEGKAPSEIRRNIASTGLLQDQAVNMQLQRPAMLQQFERNQADIARLLQETKTGAALEAKYAQDAITSGYSAKKLQADTNALETFGPPGSSLPGMMRAFLDKMYDDPKTTGSAKSLWERHQEFRRERAEKTEPGPLWSPWWEK